MEVHEEHEDHEEHEKEEEEDKLMRSSGYDNRIKGDKVTQKDDMVKVLVLVPMGLV